MPVLQNRLTRTQNHRAMTLDQSGKAQFGHVSVSPAKPLQELAVGQVSDSAGFEYGLNMLKN